MRTRSMYLIAALMALVIAGGLVGVSGNARAQEENTPIAEEAAPAAVPGAGVVTMVAWYAQDPSGDFLAVGPIATNEALLAGPGDPVDGQVTGQIDLESPDNDGMPRFVIGDTVLDAYPVYAEDPESIIQGIYYNDDPNLRPATLVIQVYASAGPYEGYDGMAIIVSRAPGAGGVITIVLNPPA